MKKSTSEYRGASTEVLQRKGALLEKRYGLGDIQVLRTNFHYWRQKGFLNGVEDGKWTSLSLVECIWVNILTSLKNFGCSAKTMAWVNKALFQDAYEENLADKIARDNLAYYANLERQRPLTADETFNLQVLRQTLEDILLKDYFRHEISYLYHLILKILESNADAGIIITEEGTCQRYIEYPDSASRRQERHPDFPHIRIPIANYLRSFFSDESKAEQLREDGVLTENDLWVIREMRNNNIRSLKIYFREDDHAIEKVEVEEKGLMSKEKSKEVMSLLGMKNYSRIELNTRDGQHISFTRTIRKFL